MPKFNVGDYVVYSINGACEIVEIGPLSFGGQDKDYYSMKPFSDSRSTIYLPVTKEEEIKRPVMDKENVLKLLEKAKTVKPLNIQASREKCEPIIKSGDFLEIVKLIKMLRFVKVENRKIHKGLNIQEEKLLREAEIVIYSEIAVSLGISIEDASLEYTALLD